MGDIVVIQKRHVLTGPATADCPQMAELRQADHQVIPIPLQTNLSRLISANSSSEIHYPLQASQDGFDAELIAAFAPQKATLPPKQDSKSSLGRLFKFKIEKFADGKMLQSGIDIEQTITFRQKHLVQMPL